MQSSEGVIVVRYMVFVKMREERDRTLATPRLLIPSIQVNMRAGRFTPADQHGVR